jgi:hypothetical protein
MHGDVRNKRKVFFGKLEGKRVVERIRYKWKCNNKMDVREILFEGVKFFLVVQDRPSQCEQDNEVSDSIK